MGVWPLCLRCEVRVREWFYREMPEVLEGRRTEKGDMDMKKKMFLKKAIKQSIWIF